MKRKYGSKKVFPYFLQFKSEFGNKEKRMANHFSILPNRALHKFSSVAQSCPTLCIPMGWSTQASSSITNSWSLLKLMYIESVMPSNHLILCHPLLLPSGFPIIRVFSNESAVCIRWPKYWSFSFSISPSNEYSGLISFMGNRWGNSGNSVRLYFGGLQNHCRWWL